MKSESQQHAYYAYAYASNRSAFCSRVLSRFFCSKQMIYFAVALLVAVASAQVYHTEQMDMNGMDNYVLQWGVTGCVFLAFSRVFS
jgi:hypothetical protein